jgi:hypothetical protein
MSPPLSKRHAACPCWPSAAPSGQGRIAPPLPRRARRAGQSPQPVRPCCRFHAARSKKPRRNSNVTARLLPEPNSMWPLRKLSAKHRNEECRWFLSSCRSHPGMLKLFTTSPPGRPISGTSSSFSPRKTSHISTPADGFLTAPNLETHCISLRRAPRSSPVPSARAARIPAI